MAGQLIVGPEAPGALDLVREFVNSRDVEAGTDQLQTPSGWSVWAGEHQLDQSRVTAAELGRLVDLREALRAALIANHDGRAIPDEVADQLSQAGSWAELTVEFTGSGAVTVSRETGARGVAGQLLATVSMAMTDGTWSRLKACGNDLCRWAFYDHSRSRTGTWCSMEVCGNRAKQSRWRERQSAVRTASG